ncbi:hypothetical protein BOY45_004074, partial [Shigella flexneri]|nr:hypothetical protein [Shigella flexneri]
EEDLNLYFDELRMTSFDRERIIELWRADPDKKSAIEQIMKIEKMIYYRRAEEKWKEAQNYYYYNLLFLSDSVSEKCKDLLDVLGGHLIYLDPEFDFKLFSPGDLREGLEIHDKLHEMRNSVKTAMQNELRKE